MICFRLTSFMLQKKESKLFTVFIERLIHRKKQTNTGKEGLRFARPHCAAGSLRGDPVSHVICWSVSRDEHLVHLERGAHFGEPRWDPVRVLRAAEFDRDCGRLSAWPALIMLNLNQHLSNT